MSSPDFAKGASHLTVEKAAIFWSSSSTCQSIGPRDWHGSLSSLRGASAARCEPYHLDWDQRH